MCYHCREPRVEGRTLTLNPTPAMMSRIWVFWGSLTCCDSRKSCRSEVTKADWPNGNMPNYDVYQHCNLCAARIS